MTGCCGRLPGKRRKIRSCTVSLANAACSSGKFHGWPGYEQSKSVRVGNAAATQLQLDVYGEVADAMHQARKSGMGVPEQSAAIERDWIEYLERIWMEPDEGIWEVRGGRQQFTHSKVMAWVAVDRRNQRF